MLTHPIHRSAKLRTAVCLGLAALAPVLTRAQAPTPAPTPNAPFTPWVSAEDYSKFHAEGAEGKNLDIVVTQVDGPNGPTPGFRFTSREVSNTAWGEQAAFNVPRAVEPGDVLSAHFYMRTIKSLVESGEGVTTFVVESALNSEKSLAFNAKVANQWREFNLPFTVKTGYAEGKGRVIFRLGVQKQTIEIADLEVRNYKKALPLASLPMTKPDLSYFGMEPNAPWRAEAAARIAKIRQSTLTVQVVDAAGKPVPDAKVEVKQTRHAFGFGSAVNAEALIAPPGPDGHNLYAETIIKNYNMVTIDNALKWPRWEQSHQLAIDASKWCKDHDITLRGHNLIWPSWRHFPNNLKNLKDKPDELHAAALKHVEEEATALAPYTSIWDVVNETYDNHDLMDICGEHILVDIFELAKKSAPKTTMFINDYNILSNNGLDHGHQDTYEKVIKYLKDQHAPLEGVGMQAHFGSQFTPPTRIYEILDRYAKYGTPIQLTEFTLDGEDPAANAHYTQDVMTMVFSHPAVNAFISWGSITGIDFPHKAEYFDEKGQLTAVGKAWHDLVYSQWWTHENLTTAANGTGAVQAYHGQYEVTASRGSGKPVTATAEVKPGGSTVKLVLAQ